MQGRALAGCQLVFHSSTHTYTRALLTIWRNAKTLEELRQVFDISQLWKAFHTAAALNYHQSKWCGDGTDPTNQNWTKS
jgi:hypothetical protein